MRAVRIAMLASGIVMAALCATRREATCAEAPADAAAAAFGLRPYPVAPGSTEMTITWTATASAEFALHCARAGERGRDLAVPPLPDLIEYQLPPSPNAPEESGLDTELEVPPPVREYQYVARLTDLVPNAAHTYRVSGAGLEATGAFRTLPESEAEFSVVAYGDSQEPRGHRDAASCFAKWNPTFLLHTGDLTDNGRRYPLWKRGFFEPLGDLAASVPVQPARGNHDGGGLLRRLFPRPEGRLYYSFDCGSAHFVCLDVFADRADMLAWLAEDLAASRARWKIAYAHFPSYDAGAHGSAWGRDDVLPLLRKHGVDLVLSGHTHNYQRTLPMFTLGENEKHPITFVVTGGGGGQLHRLAQDPCLAAGAMDNHYMVMTFAPSELRVRVLAPDARELDSFSIRKAADGSLTDDYLAKAVPESTFGELRRLVAPAMTGLTPSADLRSGRPVKVSLALSAGDRAMKFSVRPERRAQEHYEMPPLSGQTPPGGTAEVTAEIRLREPDLHADAAARLPPLRLECVFELGGRTASVFSNRIDQQQPAIADPRPLEDTKDEDE